MQRLIFVISYPFLWLLAILPFPLLYMISDFVYLWVYHVVGYRRKVVDQNLALAFPKLSASKRNKIRKEFYHHFCDSFLEMIKTLKMSDKQLKTRFKILNPEMLKEIEGQKKSYILLMGHYASYEWVHALHFHSITFKAYGVYKPIKNNHFDKLIRKIRGKYNTHMLPNKTVPKIMLKNKKNNTLSSYGLVADQSPRPKNAKHYVNFFNHKVPSFVGPEYLAKKLNLSVVYLKVIKIKRGRYEAELLPITYTPKRYEDFKLTDLYYDLLEKQINENPAYYLWTHKRWKHKLSGFDAEKTS
ncbi:lysophospholipid acyltransferase family protein [uncultured Mesonia sp.]|uniref:lysophospholipid acyltransferase family protein n=1 Tax=uncultured Mesonia sp. TaxID=399731 RepID=UPI00374FB798